MSNMFFFLSIYSINVLKMGAALADKALKTAATVMIPGGGALYDLAKQSAKTGLHIAKKAGGKLEDHLAKKGIKLKGGKLMKKLSNYPILKRKPDAYKNYFTDITRDYNLQQFEKRRLGVRDVRRRGDRSQPSLNDSPSKYSDRIVGRRYIKYDGKFLMLKDGRPKLISSLENENGQKIFYFIHNRKGSIIRTADSYLSYSRKFDEVLFTEDGLRDIFWIIKKVPGSGFYFKMGQKCLAFVNKLVLVNCSSGFHSTTWDIKRIENGFISVNDKPSHTIRNDKRNVTFKNENRYDYRDINSNFSVLNSMNNVDPANRLILRREYFMKKVIKPAYI